MTDRQKRKRASLSESGGGAKKPQTLVEQAADEMQRLQRNGNAQLDSYYRLHARESLLAYLEECPLLQCCDAVTHINSDAFVEPFVQLVLNSSQSPVRGICFALRTYLAALQALVSEASYTASVRVPARTRPGPLVLTLEHESRATMTAIARSNLMHSGEVSISDDRNMLALYNDRQLDYLAQYAAHNLHDVTFFTLTLHDRLVQTMLVPPSEHQYELQLRANHNIRSYATLERELRELKQQVAVVVPQAVDPGLQAQLDEAKTQLAAAQQLVVKREAKIALLEKQAEGLKEVARKAVYKSKSGGKKAKKR